MRLDCVIDILDIPGLMDIPDIPEIPFRIMGLTYILEPYSPPQNDNNDDV